MCVDHNGNVITTGQFAGTITFGNVTLTANGTDDIFLAKYGPTGTLLWAKRVGGQDNWLWDQAIDLATDGMGNIYLLGIVGDGPALYDGIDVAEGSTNAAFLMKCEPDGTYCWSHRLSPEGWMCLAVTASGESHTFIEYGNSITWFKYDTNGSLIGQWSIPPFGLWGPRASCTSDGGVLLGFGSSGQSFDLDPSSNARIVNPGNNGSAVVAKYSANGAYQWHCDSSGDSSPGSYEHVIDLAVDPDDNALVLIDNYSSGAVSFADLQLPDENSIVKLGPDGSGKWSLQVMVTDGGNTADLPCYHLAVDMEGAVYASGPITWVPDSGEEINGTPLPYLSLCAYVAKFDANGTPLWAVAPEIEWDYTYTGWSAIAVKVPDALVVAGVTTSDASFPPFDFNAPYNQLLIAQLGESNGLFGELPEQPLLYPVPTNDLLFVPAPTGALLNVFDMGGRLVMQERQGTDGWLDVVHLPPGAYQLQMELDSRIAQSRFVIVR